jgi:hypothetical protein
MAAAIAFIPLRYFGYIEHVVKSPSPTFDTSAANEVAASVAGPYRIFNPAVANA